MQHYQCIDTKHSDKQRLRAMDYQRKNRCIGFADAIENHHANHGKMPRPCPVGSGNHHRYAACNKQQQASQYRKVAGKLETEEA